jgi:hypothetical protein
MLARGHVEKGAREFATSRRVSLCARVRQGSRGTADSPCARVVRWHDGAGMGGPAMSGQ